MKTISAIVIAPPAFFPAPQPMLRETVSGCVYNQPEPSVDYGTETIKNVPLMQTL